MLVAVACGSAGATPWRGIEPGTSERPDVETLFGAPSREVRKADGRLLAYVHRSAPSGTSQVQFHLDASGRVTRIDVFPTAEIGLTDVINSLGPQCTGDGETAAEPPPGCFVRKVAGGAQIYLLYRVERVAVFLSPRGNQVRSFSYLSALRKKTPPRATTGGVASSGTTESAGADQAGAGDDSWSTSAGFGETSSESESSQRVDPTLTFAGHVQVEGYEQIARAPSALITSRRQVELSLSARSTFTHGSAAGTLLFRRDFVDPSRNRFDLSEASASWARGPVQLSAGRLLVAWGTANLINPTDVVNAWDRRDLLAPERLGSWAVRTGLVLGPLLIEGYYLPIPEATRYPDISLTPEGELRSRSPWVRGALPQPGPLPLRYALGEVSPPSPSLRSSQAAGRIALSLLGADLSLGYAYLYDRLPTPRTTVSLSPPTHGDVRMDLEYRRAHVFTLDFERTFGRLRIAGEAAAHRFLRPKEGDVERLVGAGVGGFDVESAQFFDSHTVRFFLEYFHAHAFEGELRDDFFGRLRYPFRRLVLARLAYTGGSAFRVELNAFRSLDDRSMAFNPAVEFTLSDALVARLSGYLLVGSDDPRSLLWKERDNSRAEARLEAKF